MIDCIESPSRGQYCWIWIRIHTKFSVDHRNFLHCLPISWEQVNHIRNLGVHYAISQRNIWCNPQKTSAVTNEIQWFHHRLEQLVGIPYLSTSWNILPNAIRRTLSGPECYVELVNRFRYYLHQPLRFKTRSKHEYINAFREYYNSNYPIGSFGDEIEIQFLHYDSKEEAEVK